MGLQVVVLGGSGGIGRAVVEELVTRGHAVTSASRSGGGTTSAARHVAVDLYDADATRTVCDGADVVVMAAQPEYGTWEGRLLPMVEAALSAAAAAGARFVLTDNLYAYGAPDGPITEGSPEAATTPSNVLRREVGQHVLAAHRDGRVRAVVGRFSDYFGPHGTNSGLWMLAIEPGLRGRTMRALLELDVPHTYAYLPDAARAFATLVEDDRGDGRTWILPHAPAVTQREMLGFVAAELPAPVRIGRLAPLFVRLGALLRIDDAVGLQQVAHQFTQPWLVDGSAFEERFGPHPTTPLPEAVAATVAHARGAAELTA